ncbi:MAG: N-acyl homoserine lactonase family protein [Nitrospirae bacterium]|nr:N-acyl homoserine lactonase family protein [Nitrospirota bacterium]
MAQYKIHPIVMGSKLFDKTMMTYQYGYGQMYNIPIYCWLIEGEGVRIVVDTGEAAPGRSEARQKALGAKIYTFEDGLAKWNLAPSDINIILHTHLHNDHCENDDKCVNANIYVHEKELVRVHEPHPLDFRYMEDYIVEVEESGQIKPLTKDTEILPGITMIHTPAHTEGGMSVMVETPAGKAVITGFCCIMENFNPPPAIRGMDMDVIPPGTHVNVYDSYDIMLKIKAMADILLPLHEPEFAVIDTI